MVINVIMSNKMHQDWELYVESLKARSRTTIHIPPETFDGVEIDGKKPITATRIYGHNKMVIFFSVIY